MSSRNQSPTSALIAHVEQLVSGARILVVGSAQNLVPDHLLARGARLVQILDPDAKTVALAAAHNTERRVSYAQLTETSLRDAAFDCAIVEDLGQAEDPERLLLGVRRSIGPRGVALISSSASDKTSGLLGVSPGRIGYDELEEMTSRVFEDVMMLGQAPFVGYSVVSLSLDAPPEPCLDNDFLSDSEAADRFVAICGSEETLSELDLEDMTIVQLPASPVLEDGESLHRERERRAQRRIDSLQSELSKLRRQNSPGEVEALTRQLEERDSWIRDLEARAANAEAKVDDLEAALSDREDDSQNLELASLREELDSSKRQAARSQKETRWAEERVRKLERELEAALSEIEEAEGTNLGLELRERVTELEAESATLKRERKDLEAAANVAAQQLAETEEELEETHRDLLGVSSDLAAARAEVARLTRELDQATARAQESERKHALERRKLADQPTPELGGEIQRMEQQLRERGSKIQELEEQLRKLELFSKTLTAELSQYHGKGQVEQLEVELDRLSQSLAEREADLVAAEWTIGELKQRLSARPS